MIPSDHRIARLQRTLRSFEEDIPLLNLRVKELSAERQESALHFAATLIDQTRAELQKLIAEQQERRGECVEEAPCEPAD